jgi:HD superfamily phosphodiesterase
MKISTILLNRAFEYVILASKKYNIDESHSIKHSIEVLNFANSIYESELINNKYIIDHHDIICTASILHDMCDKKYMDESLGINEIKLYMKDHINRDRLDIVCSIIKTMSYSKVISNGYPNLGEYQLSYHIVREADLLAAYDIDRCIIYGLMVEKLSYTDAIIRSKELFNTRILKYIENNLYVTDYAKKLAIDLHMKSLLKINNLILD